MSPRVVSPTELRLPRLGSAWAAWCTKVFGARLEFSVPVGGRVWIWKPVCHDAVRSPAPRYWACTLHGNAGGQPFTCWLDSLLPLTVPPLHHEDLALLPHAPLPEALLAAVMQDVAGESLAQLGAALGQPVTLYSLRCAPASTPEEAVQLDQGLAFTLTLDGRADINAMADAGTEGSAGNPAVTVRGLLAAEWPHPFFTALHKAAGAALHKTAGAAQQAALPRWPLPCPVVWRTRPLALADIRALEAGDVLLMPCTASSHALPVRVQPDMTGPPPATGRGSWYFAARWCAAQRTVTLETAMQQDMPEYEENTVTDVTDVPDSTSVSQDMAAHEAAPSPAAATLDQCRVPIQCRLGEVSVSLAELAALAPGAVLQALDSVEAPVTLWLGATRIGRGALVDVDGRIGVRITEILSAAHGGEHDSIS